MYRPTMYLWTCLVVLCSFTYDASGATVSLDSILAEQGDTDAVMPLLLAREAPEDVSAIQADITFDSDVFEFVEISAGPVALAATKEASASVVAKGVLRVIVSGMNLDVIESGTVAYLRFGVSPTAVPLEYQFAVEGLIVSDPYGDELPATAAGGTFTVQPLAQVLGVANPTTLAALALLLALFGATTQKTRRSGELTVGK